ncbi:MAG: aminotransferase class I/II-fold pyridoxal phosphate-dependent enzyme, partial [Sphingomonadaceae bacterium]
MNPRLGVLQPYPFEKLRALMQGITPNERLRPINLSIGEPKHATPELVRRALTDALEGLSVYPATAGTPELRAAIAGWLGRRYGLPPLDPATQVLPVNGSREALFAFAQAIVDPDRPGAKVVCPNPFYQIYEGAALLAGANPVYLNATEQTGFRMRFDALPESMWHDVQLVYSCSPANPSGSVMRLEDWRTLFALADRHGFVIASDECYSELYFDEAQPPLGGLQAARQLGRDDFARLVVFSSLSKRSNVPGMRSGFVAGDA